MRAVDLASGAWTQIQLEDGTENPTGTYTLYAPFVGINGGEGAYVVQADAAPTGTTAPESAIRLETAIDGQSPNKLRRDHVKLTVATVADDKFWARGVGSQEGYAMPHICIAAGELW